MNASKTSPVNSSNSPTLTTHTSSMKNASPSGIATSWLLRERVQPSPPLPKSTRYTLKTKQGYLVADTHEIGLQASLWTDDQTQAQVYLDQENAFHKAGLLSTLADCSVEVVVLE